LRVGAGSGLVLILFN